MHYQPIFDRNRKKIVSLEALVRWNHPERGLVQPAEFIGLAEETGLIVPIGEWVLRRVCHDLREWRAAGLPPMRVGVNISAPQFQQLSFALVVGSILREYACDPALLELEITETVAVQNIETTMNAMRELKELGIRIAIDDFGTGQSSLVYLKRFPIDTVKIDRAFVRDVTTDESAAAIVVVRDQPRAHAAARGRRRRRGDGRAVVVPETERLRSDAGLPLQRAAAGR